MSEKLKPCTCKDAEGITECAECGGVLYRYNRPIEDEQAKLIEKLIMGGKRVIKSWGTIGGGRAEESVMTMDIGILNQIIEDCEQWKDKHVT
jgi:hypothetical protein